MFEEITQADLVNKGVEGLPDTPNLETAEMQRKFDEITKEVIVPKFNALIQKLNNDLGSDIKMIDPKDDTSKTLSALIGEIEDEVGLNTADRHNHANKALLDSLTAILFEGYNRLVTMLAGVNSVTDVVTNDTTVLPSGKAIVDFVQQMGGGDMLKEVYDTDNDGVVDNADALNGHPDTYFATVTALQALGSLVTALQSLVLAVGTSESTPADTWTALQALKGQNIARLQMNALGDAKIFKSADGGSTWDGGSPVGGDKSDLATVEPGTTATAPYAAGDHVVVNDVYHEVTAAIAIGDTFVEGTNIDVRTVGGEITALNQNLMNSCVYNPQDDWIYISNTKWKKAFLQSLIYFNDTLGYNAEDFGTIAHTISGSGVSCSGSSNIQSSYIEFNATGNLTVNTGATTYTGCSQFTSSEYVDITAYDKLVVQGVYKANSAPPYYIGYLRVKIVDANGNITQLTNIQSNNGNANKNIDVELDLTQYSGEYKLQFEFASSFTSCTAGEHVTNNFKLNNCYFM